MARAGISKKTRFEVFKRDSFTCQYCGAKAPDVVLEVDHIQPVAQGGTNEIMNLVTSCRDCNSGKGARRLSDSAVINRQREQLEELQQRREQLEMLFNWKRELLELEEHAIAELADYWRRQVSGWQLNENGLAGLKRLLRKYEPHEIMEGMKVSAVECLEYGAEDPTKESVEKAWDYVGRICSVNRASKDKPYLKDLFYVRGILRNRLSYVNEQRALELLERCVELGADIDSLREHAKSVRNWTQWRQGVEFFIARWEHIEADSDSGGQTEEGENRGESGDSVSSQEAD